MQIPSEPIITKVAEGEYSTIVIEGSDHLMAETVFFSNEGTSRFVSRTIISARTIHDRHVTDDYYNVKTGL